MTQRIITVEEVLDGMPSDKSVGRDLFMLTAQQSRYLKNLINISMAELASLGAQLSAEDFKYQYVTKQYEMVLLNSLLTTSQDNLENLKEKDTTSED